MRRVRSSADCSSADFNRGIYPQTDRFNEFHRMHGILEYIWKPKRFCRASQGWADPCFCPITADGGRIHREVREETGEPSDNANRWKDVGFKWAGVGRCECAVANRNDVYSITRKSS